MNTAQVAKAANVSFRQLQWWDERGIVCPSQGGHKRDYSDAEVRSVMILSDLRRRGFPLRMARLALKVKAKVAIMPGEYLIGEIRGKWTHQTTEGGAMTAALKAIGPVVIIQIPEVPVIAQKLSQRKPLRRQYRTSFSTYSHAAAL